MNKIFAILTVLASLAGCIQDIRPRIAIQRAIKEGLSMPESFHFVGMDRVDEITVADEVERVAEKIPKGTPSWANSHLYYPAQEEKAEQLRQYAAILDQEEILGAVYRFRFRADVPEQGRDIPQEVYVLASLDGKTVGRISRNARDARRSCGPLIAGFSAFIQ